MSKRPAKPTPKPPRRVPDLHRAQLDCLVARDALAGKADPPPAGLTRTDYALYNLASAIKHIARHLEAQHK